MVGIRPDSVSAEGAHQSEKTMSVASVPAGTVAVVGSNDSSLLCPQLLSHRDFYFLMPSIGLAKYKDQIGAKQGPYRDRLGVRVYRANQSKMESRFVWGTVIVRRCHIHRSRVVTVKKRTTLEA